MIEATRRTSGAFLAWLDEWYAGLEPASLDDLLAAAGGPERAAVFCVDLSEGFCRQGPLSSPRVAAIMADEGFRVPTYTVTHVPLDRAADVLDLAPEEFDVTQSDVLGDPAPFTRDFRIALTSLDTAIRAAVRAERREVR